jgi:hypothetical protein
MYKITCAQAMDELSILFQCTVPTQQHIKFKGLF